MSLLIVWPSLVMNIGLGRITGQQLNLRSAADGEVWQLYHRHGAAV